MSGEVFPANARNCYARQMNFAVAARLASSGHRVSASRSVPTSPATAWQRLSFFVAAGLLSLSLGGCGKPQTPTAAPAEVAVAPVERRDVPVTQEWVASLYGFVDAQIRAQVSGLLLRQNYRDGARVKKGELLFEIDPRPFRAALAQAQGQLAQAEAQVGKTEADVKRYGPLAKQQAISQQELDDAVQANLAAKAQVASGQAAVEQAQLNLDFAHITSPVDGIAGIVQTQVGNLVGPGTGILTTVSTVDPMKVYFPISEQAYLDFTEGSPEAEANRFLADAKLELILSNGSVYPYPGKFYAVDRQIDPNTGTLQIAALFPNPRNTLRPGQYGRVRAVVKTVKDALLVPERALAELQGGDQVVTVDASNKAHLQAVIVGARVGGLAVIEKGLKPGDRVIVDGANKVREGSPVNPRSR
jgi:membrane fusion protein (multidrug efflux system)